MKKTKRQARRPVVPTIASQPPASSKPGRRPAIRYALYAAAVVTAIGLHFWLKGPSIPTPPLANLDPLLVEDIENARAAIWQSPTRPESWGRLGMLLVARSYPTEAIACFRKAESLDEQNWKWPYLRSIAEEESDPQAALDALREAAVAAGDDEPLPRLQLADRLMERGQLDEAGEHLAALAHAWPKHAQVCLMQARWHFAQGRPQDAAEALGPALVDRRTRRAANQLAAQAHARLGDSMAAAAAAARAADLPPDEMWPDSYREEIEGYRMSRGALIARINKLRAQGDAQRLSQAIAQAMERFPDLAKLVAGRQRLDQHDAAGAVAALREAVRIYPNSVDAQLALGDALALERNLAEAADCYRRAIAIDPSHGEAHLRLGQALLKLGDAKAAAESLSAAVHFMPTSAEAHTALADLLRQTGDTAAADEHLRHAEKLKSLAAAAR
jgi:tetratricopeptide (TPR) repeat protein